MDGTCNFKGKGYKKDNLLKFLSCIMRNEGLENVKVTEYSKDKMSRRKQ